MADQKTQDHQAPNKEERAGFGTDEITKGSDRQGGSEIKDITAEASHRDVDGILRQTLRGDESKGDPDERDIAGAIDFEDTPHGREETKNDKAGAANQNG